jgi:hypothetical protein
VLNPDDRDQILGVVDAIDDLEGAATRGVEARELSPQWSAHAARVRDQGTGHELDDSGGNTRI